jgi:uncharacterized protein (DUF302 family)
MLSTIAKITAGAALALSFVVPLVAQADDNGVVRMRSAYSMQESIARVKADIAAKGIAFFAEIDQSALAATADIALRPSTLLLFGNPGLGSHFITANSDAGLDWPVRLLLTQDETGAVWAVYNDFGWIARRHAITSRDAQFTMASRVIGSIVSTLTAEK